MLRVFWSEGTKSYFEQSEIFSPTVLFSNRKEQTSKIAPTPAGAVRGEVAGKMFIETEMLRSKI
jgi:hypothetical protein